MKYQWLKDDEEPLSDGEDYKGTTTAELVIVGTGPQVKGNYKCLVKHKYGEILSTGAYCGMQCCAPLIENNNTFLLICCSDPFVAELTLKGVSKTVISKLKGRYKVTWQYSRNKCMHGLVN